MSEPDSLTLRILREMRAEMATKADLNGLRAEMATKSGLQAGLEALRTEMKSDMRSLRADVASDILTMRKELTEQIVGLRRAVMEYHTVVVGHGVLIGDLEARLRRVELHLNLPPLVSV